MDSIEPRTDASQSRLPTDRKFGNVMGVCVRCAQRSELPQKFQFALVILGAAGGCLARLCGFRTVPTSEGECSLVPTWGTPWSVVNPIVMGVLFFGLISRLRSPCAMCGRDPLRLSHVPILVFGCSDAARPYCRQLQEPVLIGANMQFALELWRFLRARKKLWMLPLILVLLVIGGLLIAAQGSVLAPFIYTLF